MTDTFTEILRIDGRIMPFVREAAHKLNVQLNEHNGRIVFDDPALAVKVMEQALAIATEQMKRSAE